MFDKLSSNEQWLFGFGYVAATLGLVIFGSKLWGPAGAGGSLFLAGVTLVVLSLVSNASKHYRR